HSDNKSSSASVGVTFGFGQQNGISFQLGAQNGKGHANGSETTWDNTLITATDSLNVRSGQDATLRGAQLAANQVTMDVGRNLSIETLQDRSNYETEQKSSGWGISLCIPPICYGSSSASVNASNQNVKHNYQSAQGQSGIAAGTGGFDISVGQHTDLIGAAITGDSADNRLVTASLSSRDLTNTQNTDSHADSMALSGSFGISGGIQMPNPVSQAGNNLSSNILGNKALKAGMPASGSEQSQTVSVISPGHIRITGSGDAAQDAQSQATADALQSRDPKTANQSLKNTLTLQQAAELEQQLKKAQADAQAARILAQTGQQMANDIGTLAGKRMDALKQQADAARKAGDNAQADALDAEAKKWDEGGAYRIALHTLAGALTGGVDGALGAGASAAAIPQISEQIKAMGLPKATQDALIALADTAVGAAVGGTAGGSAALNQVANNYLKHDEIIEKAHKKAACEAGNENACQRVKELDALSTQRDVDLKTACSSGASSACSTLLDEARQASIDNLSLANQKLPTINASNLAQWQEKIEANQAYYRYLGALSQVLYKSGLSTSPERWGEVLTPQQVADLNVARAGQAPELFLAGITVGGNILNKAISVIMERDIARKTSSGAGYSGIELQ
ncbi:MAG: hemagglutinin repeat-containing protein, partial [Betaproteobacteria bacterium]|nr:hemagglutinin repeat-containing protein [Betaproteobacteria bacterium]